MQQDGDGFSSTARTPVMMGTGLDAGTGATPAQPDTGTALPQPVVDAGMPTYTMVNITSTGFEDGGCGASAIEATQVVVQDEKIVEEEVKEVQPVAIYIVLDQSRSMEQQGLWVPAKEALKGFVNDPASAGIDVALELFPDDQFAFDPTGLSELLGVPLVPICDGSQNDVPFVPMGRLPGHVATFTQALDNRAATGVGTPIATALRGAGRFCSRFEQSSMGEDCVAVLVTDGAPLGCESTQPELEQIAATIYAGGMGTRLFMVGLQGADFGLLDALARAGGAVDCDENSARFACDVSGGPNQLRDALQKIRNVVTTVNTRIETTTRIEDVPVECEWTIPPPPPGERFDRDRVNIRATAPSLAAPLDLGQVANAGACVEKGWHYDKPDAPTRLIACPQTCSMLKATPLARIDILLGCATVTLE